jgi:hypothetical protein
MIAAWSAAFAAPVERSLAYHAGEVGLEGFHVYDDTVEGARPAILVIHQ